LQRAIDRVEHSTHRSGDLVVSDSGSAEQHLNPIISD
jgi:hypothetical protein